MLKRTPGKWVWALSPEPEKFGRAGIFVEGEDGPPLTPKVGDMQLMSYAPEMHEMLCQISDELDEALSQGVITEGIREIVGKLADLLKEINVERQDRDEEVRR